MEDGLSNRVIVITGASRGLGSAFAEHFAQEGAFLGLLARDQLALNKLAQRLPTETVPIRCDVTDADQVSAAFQKIFETFGRVDSVVVNAGGQSSFRRAEELPVDKWREIVDLNLTGAYLTARFAYEYLQKSRAGKIVFVSSGVVKLPQSGSSAYVASKAALKGLVRSLCVEWAVDNICVNAVLPGLIDCGAGQDIIENVRNKVIGRTALRGTGKPSDVARIVLYMAGESCEFVTGQIVSVDGGLGLR